MKSFIALTITTILIMSAFTVKSAAALDLSAHPWQHPKVGDVRSPCPALNTLANHGYLPRDGKQIDAGMLVSAMQKVYNIGTLLGNFFARAAIRGVGQNGRLDLDALHKHGFIEHDVSLVRDDSALDRTGGQVNQTLVQQLAASSSDGRVVTLNDLAQFRRVRLEQCQASNSAVKFDLKEKQTAFGEASLLMNVFGGRNRHIETASVVDFLGQERLPVGYQLPENSVGFLRVLKLSYQLQRKSSASK